VETGYSITAVVREQPSEHVVSLAMIEHTKMEETISVQSVPELHNED
jgi:hypothetical protein